MPIPCQTGRTTLLPLPLRATVNRPRFPWTRLWANEAGDRSAYEKCDSCPNALHGSLLSFRASVFAGDRSAERGHGRLQVPGGHGHAEVDPPTPADDPMDVGRFEQVSDHHLGAGSRK